MTSDIEFRGSPQPDLVAIFVPREVADMLDMLSGYSNRSTMYEIAQAVGARERSLKLSWAAKAKVTAPRLALRAALSAKLATLS